MSMDFCVVVAPDGRALHGAEVACVLARLDAAGYLERCRVLGADWEGEAADAGRAAAEAGREALLAWVAEDPGQRYVRFDVVRAARIAPDPDILHRLTEALERCASLADDLQQGLAVHGMGLSGAGLHFWLETGLTLGLDRFEAALPEDAGFRALLDLVAGCVEGPLRIVTPETPQDL